ncbi:potassium channel family protein [Lysobacter korlensis]|uniref:Potassium channel family protein n=1 Tax=Lysobacter korlensis TaxID=553636 RepID=A0ABV6S009_9GAMM
MVDGFAIGLGGVLVGLALLDVFLTVLYSRAGVGLLTPRLYRATWRLLRFVGGLAGERREAVLSFSGPVMMLLTVAMWFLLLLVGFSLLVWPALGDAIVKSSGPTPTDWWSAVYYAGYSLTTLGTGDLVPRTAAYRLLMVVKSLVGFSIITLAVTYFMAVYSSLVRRNTLAQMLHHLSGATGDAVQLLIRVERSGWLTGGKGGFMDVGLEVLGLLESHHSYPVLHYFRMRDPRYSMARMAVLVLQPLTLARSVLAASERENELAADASMLWGGGIDLLRQAGQSPLDRQALNGPDPADRSHFRLACRQLEDAGAQLVGDQSEAEEKYRALRGQWIGAASAFAELMGHRWEQVEPGHDRQPDSK